ncbi:MAG: radical SAM protein [Nitrospirota bacterium]
MKVLLVSLNRESEPFTAAPIGLALVGSSLKEAGHEVSVLDLLFSDDPAGDLKKAVLGFEPGLIGLSIRNIESSTEFLMPRYRELVQGLAAYTDAPVAAGGPAFSIMPRQALSYLGLKYGVAGEGEAAAVGLARALETGADPASVPGVCTLDNGEFSLMPGAPIEGSALKSPDWSLLPVHRYDMVGVQSKRGCSFSCIYCTYPSLEGRRMRLRNPGEVAGEMESAVAAGIKAPFYFVDNVFNNPRGHAEDICDEMVRRGVEVSWGCLATPSGLDKGLIHKMKSAGCESLEIGADSLSGRMLKGLGKNFTPQDVERAVAACKETGTMHMVFLILGGPGEGEDTLSETFEALESLSPDKVFAVSGVRIYPGTPIAARAPPQ